MLERPIPPNRPEIIEELHWSIDEWRVTLDLKIDSLHRAIDGIDDPRDVLQPLPQIDPPQFGAIVAANAAGGVADVVTTVQSVVHHGIGLLDQLRSIVT